MTTILTANGRPFDPEAFFKALSYYEELGDWHIVDVSLASAKSRAIMGSGNDELKSRLFDWQKKLKVAEAYERAHGWGALIKWDHPFNLENRQMIEDMLAARLTYVLKGRSSSAAAAA